MLTVRVVIGDVAPNALQIRLTSLKFSPRRNAELMSQDSTCHPRCTAELARSFWDSRVAVEEDLAKNCF